ncbi:hypothetical protein niasHS_006049 [Heterodera schachtii]|uniref:Uncharacterized protein n=1 Tax=Heterodera schachtii TaxID=97005 RepID=A0ABD2JVW7_HETSC
MTASTESSKRFISSQEEQMRQTQQVHEESVREMEQIRHTNATLDMTGSDSFRAQTEQAAIKIVTPFYKLGEKPGAEVKLGSSVADLGAKFAQADSDYKAERSAEHFRMQIIEPKVISHAHIPAHATRDYARRHLITDFPSLHGKRSFIDLEAIEQRKLRQQRKLPEAGDRDRDLDKFLKVREDKEQWKTPWPAPKPEDESLRELDRLRQNIDQLQKASMRRSKSLNELRPVKASATKPEQFTLPPLLPSRHKILEPPKPAATPRAAHRRRSRSATQRRGRRRRRCHTVTTEGGEWGWQESVCSSESTEMETEDEESWTSMESDYDDDDGDGGDRNHDQQHARQTVSHNFGGSDFVFRQASGGVGGGARSEEEATPQRQSTLFASQPTEHVDVVVPPPLCRRHRQQQFARLNDGTETKPVPKERLQKQVEDKAVQAEQPQYHQQQPPLGRHRDFLLVPREYGADLHEWSSTRSDHDATVVMPQPQMEQQQRRHLAPSAVADGTLSSGTSLPSPPKSILRQPQQRHQQQQHQHQYTFERHGNESGHYWEDRGEIGITVDDEDDAEEQRALYEAMQRNLALHRQPSPHPELYPSVPFNGPFFRLHEVSPDGRATRPLNAVPSAGAAVNKTSAGHPPTYAPQYQTLPPMSPRRAAASGRTSGGGTGNHANAMAPAPPPAPPPPPAGWAPPRHLQEHRHADDDGKAQQHHQQQRGDEEGGLVVVWPPFPANDQDDQQDIDQAADQQQQLNRPPKAEAPTPKNVRRDFPEEYARQERMQAEAERQRAERNARLREKQLQAVKLQQEQLSRLTTPQQYHHHQQSSPADTGIGASEPENATGASSTHRPSTSHSQTQLLSPAVAAVRVFETRPMSASATAADGASAATTTAYDPRYATAVAVNGGGGGCVGTVAYENGGGLQSPLAGTSCSSVTWRRTYVVDSERVDERNEILTSDERLARDRFNIDMLRRREQFIEKPEQPVEIRRTGKRWQPPPEKPYRWPTPTTVSESVEHYGPLSVQINGGAADEHHWVPMVRQPPYKAEMRDFVPDEPEQQIKGHGTGPLEDVARRQTAGVIMSSPDGSHRPRTEFDGARRPPAGGFVPHAPNVVRRARTRAPHAEEAPMIHYETDMVTPRRRRHVAASDSARVRHASAAPSTARGAVMQRRHDVHSEDDDYDHDHQQRLQQQQHPPAGDWDAAPETPRRLPRRQTTVVTIDDAPRAACSADQPALRNGDGAMTEGVYPEDDADTDMPRHTSTIVTLGPLPRTDVRRKIRAIEVRDRKERSRSAIARERADRSQSPAAHRAQERMRQLTQASPTPASYEHARKYVPPALPPGHTSSATSAANGAAVGMESQGAAAIPRRHARRMADAVQREASAHAHSREPLAAKLAAPHQFRRRSSTTQNHAQPRALRRAESSGRDGGRDALSSSRAMESPPSGRVHDAVYSTVRPIGDRVPSSAMHAVRPMPRGWTTEQPPPADGEVRSYRASRTVEHHRRVQRRH